MGIDLLDTKDVAGILGIQPQTLELWRQQGRGPRFVKMGRLVRYRPEDVEAFIQGRPHLQATTDAPQAPVAEAVAPSQAAAEEERVRELEGELSDARAQLLKLQDQVKRLKRQLKAARARNRAELAGLFLDSARQPGAFTYTVEMLQRDDTGLYLIDQEGQRWDMVDDQADLLSWIDVG